MVTVKDFAERKSADGSVFYALIVDGGVDLVQSQSGSFYATSRTASIASTFDADYCKQLVGTKLPGEVKRVEVEPYDYVIADTGQQVTLGHKFVYVPSNEVATA